MGAYLDSAECVNLLPTSVIFHPSLQQNRSFEGQGPCFWNSQNPMPYLDQSVARQVGLFLSKILTPVWISSTIAVLDVSKARWCASFHWNFIVGWRSSRNGSIAVVMLNVYET